MASLQRMTTIEKRWRWLGSTQAVDTLSEVARRQLLIVNVAGRIRLESSLKFRRRGESTRVGERRGGNRPDPGIQNQFVDDEPNDVLGDVHRAGGLIVGVQIRKRI